MRKKFLPSSMSHWHNLWGQSFIAFRFCRNSSNLFEIVDNACLQKDLSFLDFCHCYKTTKEISICETAKIMTVIPRVNTILFNLYVLCEITNGRENEQRKKNVNQKFTIRFFISCAFSFFCTRFSPFSTVE